MKQLLLGRNGKPVLEEYQEMPLQAGYVRVVSDYGAPKHGTELHGYEKDPFAKVYYDENTHIFRPREKELVYDGTSGLGNMWVGRITEIGQGVEGCRIRQSEKHPHSKGRGCPGHAGKYDLERGSLL